MSKLEKKVSRFLKIAESLGPTGDKVLTNAMLNSLFRMSLVALERRDKTKKRSKL